MHSLYNYSSWNYDNCKFAIDNPTNSIAESPKLKTEHIVFGSIRFVKFCLIFSISLHFFQFSIFQTYPYCWGPFLKILGLTTKYQKNFTSIYMFLTIFMVYASLPRTKKTGMKGGHMGSNWLTERQKNKHSCTKHVCFCVEWPEPEKKKKKKGPHSLPFLFFFFNVYVCSTSYVNCIININHETEVIKAMIRALPTLAGARGTSECAFDNLRIIDITIFVLNKILPTLKNVSIASE